MATFQMKLRNKLKDGRHKLAVRVIHGNEVMYLKVATITKEQYNRVFIKKSTDQASIDFRETCDGYIRKCERIFLKLHPFDKARLSQMFYEKEKEQPHSLLLKDLFDHFIDEYEGIGLKSKEHYRTTLNVLETFQPEMTVWDITPQTLNRFKKQKINDGRSLPTIQSYFRNLRRVINYYRKEKLIPESYPYPFGKDGGFSISNYVPEKVMLSNKEIQAISELSEFDNPKQEFARDMWLMCYRCNGINFADLLRMQWINKNGKALYFLRKKTENTAGNPEQIVVPLIPKLGHLIDKYGDKSSPFILGKIKPNYSESYFNNKNHKLRGQINDDLKIIGEKLKLSLPLILKESRNAYASTLYRAGIPVDFIGKMMGHSNKSVITNRYLPTLDIDKRFEINSVLF